MIEYNVSRSFPFHRCMSVIRNKVYACIITTAPESLLQGTYSMMFAFPYSADTPWQGAYMNGQWKPMAKAMLHPHLNKRGRNEFHKVMVEGLNATAWDGQNGQNNAWTTLALMLQYAKETPSMTDGRGLVTDFIVDPQIIENMEKYIQ